MTVAAGDAHPFPIYNARYRVVFPILDADGDLVTGAAGLDSEASQDQGTFADCTNEATEIATASGVYYLDLTAGEMDTQCTAVIVKTSTTGAKTTVITLYPKRLPVIRTGTAQAGAGTTITLDSGASATDDFYIGCMVNITNNSPANAQGQCRRIIDYVGSTKVATVDAAWGTNPSSASTFEILLREETAWVKAWAGAPVADPTNAGVPEVDVTHWLGTAAATPTVAGVPEVDMTHIAGAAVNTASAQIGTNVVSAGGTAWNSGAITANTLASATITAAKFATDAITATVIAPDAIGASELAADAVAEIADAIWDEDATGHQTQGTFGQAIGDPAADTTTIWGAVNTNLDATVSSRASQTSVDTIDDFLDTEIAAIKAKTDSLTFTVANVLDTNLLRINGVTTGAVNLSITTQDIGRGTCTTGGTTTSVPTSAFTPSGAALNQFVGRVILFDFNTTTAALRGQQATITGSSNAANPTFTVSTMTTAPASGDTFSVV